LPMTRHRCNLWSVDPGAKPRIWAPLTRNTREYNKDLILILIW